MLHKIRMKRGDGLRYTTICEPIDKPAPLDAFYPDTEALNSMPFDTAEFMLSICDRPFAEGEVDVALRPIPFVKSTKNKTRFEIQNKRRRRLRTSSEYPVTQAFIYNAALDAKVIAEKRPIYFGMSAITEGITADEKADAIARFDAFLREIVKVRGGGRLTSREIWNVWAARWGADPTDDVIAGIALADIARRFRATFGVTMVANPTRIRGRLQRYWSGYGI